MRRSPAFTLIELMVVIAIVAILAALLAALIPGMLFRAKAMKTITRIEGAIQGIGSVGGGDDTTAHVLHREVLVPALTVEGITGSGITRFGISRTSDEHFPVEGTWIDTTRPFLLSWPWGQPDLDPVSGVPAGVQPRRLDVHLWPRLSAEILVRAGVVPKSADYARDRSPSRPWNDAWGHPLVVGCALYQPPRNDRYTVRARQYFDADEIVVKNVNVPHINFTWAHKAYGHTRAMYLAVAAAGPRLRTVLSASDWRANSQAIWNQANAVCGGADFTEQGFTRPPWSGVKTGKLGNERCFLGSPFEVR